MRLEVVALLGGSDEAGEVEEEAGEEEKEDGAEGGEGEGEDAGEGGLFDFGGGAVVAAFDADTVVGVATASGLAGHTEDFVPHFEAAGYDAAKIFYCGESVLLPAYRGRGIGHKFFDYREAHATALVKSGRALTHSAFCAVIRDANDPRAPADYRPLGPFWMKRGYQPIAGLIGNYAWQEVSDDRERDHPMQFWIKPLTDAAAHKT